MGIPEKEIGIGVSVGGNTLVWGIGKAVKVAVGIANCVSTTVVLAVSMSSVEDAECVDQELLQDVNVTANSRESIDLPMIFNLLILQIIYKETPNYVLNGLISI